MQPIRIVGFAGETAVQFNTYGYTSTGTVIPH